MSEAHWYVVHTYSGYENKVKVDIEKTIENRNLQDQILEVSVPMLPVVELKNGVEKKADKKMFPGYVLINMVMNDDTWYVVRNTRGVTGFVGPGSKPVPLTEEEMEQLFGEEQPEMVIDATHPYADLVSENIRSACEKAGKTYLRLLRPSLAADPSCVMVDTTEEAVSYLAGTEGKILVTTGSKELAGFTGMKDYQNRL